MPGGVWPAQCKEGCVFPVVHAGTAERAAVVAASSAGASLISVVCQKAGPCAMWLPMRKPARCHWAMVWAETRLKPDPSRVESFSAAMVCPPSEGARKDNCTACRVDCRPQPPAGYLRAGPTGTEVHSSAAPVANQHCCPASGRLERHHRPRFAR